MAGNPQDKDGNLGDNGMMEGSETAHLGLLFVELYIDG